MKFEQLKCGFLISITTMFGGSSVQLMAQTAEGKTVSVESKEAYQKRFLESIAPDKSTVSVDFMVDSVDVRPSNGDFLTDVNVIQLLAYLDQDSDEYQSYMASRHIVAHELWHRICMMNDVLEKPMAASQYRNGRDNFEITASIVQLLTFRDDYIQATPEQRLLLHNEEDPKICMYLLAVDNGIISPLSQDKKDFDFEMEFIAKMVSGYWNANLSPIYARRHNAMTEKSGRKEFSSPVYNKNFTEDIKKMNRIGGIDFSELYNYLDVRDVKLFEKGYAEDKTYLEQTPGTPNYEVWITQKSKLKRFSRQTVELPNFAGNRLAEERESRPYEQREQEFKIMPIAIGQKIYPYMKIPFCAAVHLVGKDKDIKIYPHGAMDYIGRTDTAGLATIKTVNYDGSYETGQLLRGREDGTFTYFDKTGKEISRCTFRNGRPIDGGRVLFFNGERIIYLYQNEHLQQMDILLKDGKVKTICMLERGTPLNGMIPTGAEQPFTTEKQFLLYQNGNLLATVAYDNDGVLREWHENNERTLKIERFYATGQLKYAAQKSIISEAYPIKTTTMTVENGLRFADALPADGFDRPLSANFSSRQSTIQSSQHTATVPLPSPASKNRRVSAMGQLKYAAQKSIIPKAHPIKTTTTTAENGQRFADALPADGFDRPLSANFSSRQSTIQSSQYTATVPLPSPASEDRRVLENMPRQQNVKTAPTHTITRQALYALNGKPVLAIEREKGHNKFKIKIKEFVAFLQKSPLPVPQQRSLIAGLTINKDAVKQAVRYNKLNSSVDKTAKADATVDKTLYQNEKATFYSGNNHTLKHNARLVAVHPKQKTQGKAPTVFSVLKNKMRILLAQRNRNGKNT